MQMLCVSSSQMSMLPLQAKLHDLAVASQTYLRCHPGTAQSPLILKYM